MTNPYEDQFQILPIEEIRRLLPKYRLKVGRTGNENKIGMWDISREVRVNRTKLRSIMNNTKMTKGHRYDGVGPILLRRLSQFLIRAECGMIEKIDGKIVYHSEPTRPMPIVHKVSLGINGPKLLCVRQISLPKTLPSFGDMFRVPKTIDLKGRIK